MVLRPSVSSRTCGWQGRVLVGHSYHEGYGLRRWPRGGSLQSSHILILTTSSDQYGARHLMQTRQPTLRMMRGGFASVSNTASLRAPPSHAHGSGSSKPVSKRPPLRRGVAGGTLPQFSHCSANYIVSMITVIVLWSYIMRAITKVAAGLALAIALPAIPAFAQSVPIESGAIISDTSDFPRSKMISLIDPGVGLIRGYGYRCDSISAMRPFLLSRGFTIVCNNFNYEYDISDKGGNWVVELQ